MKNFQVKKMILPLAVILFGVTSAFSTQAKSASTKTSSSQQGYRFVSVLEPCRAEIMCTTDFGDICKYQNHTLWGKASQSSPCNVPLYKINN